MNDNPVNVGSWRVLSGSWLKLIAIVSMLIDHLAHFIWRLDESFFQVYFTIGSRAITPYFLLRLIGRLSFPIFAFLIVEGFQHTRSRRKYGRNLLVFALLSELPWNLVHTGTWHHSGQNVIFTLFLGFLGLCVMERYAADKRRMALWLLTLLAASIFLNADFSCIGYGFILMLYVLRHNRIVQAVVGTCLISGIHWMGGAAFIPINMYNQKRGFIKGNVSKYLFYIFYPLHLLLIYLYLRFLY